ncbi:MAG TPA: hypothetical protein VFT56_16585 [Sphingomonas sp.]|nr:hypothetical protein [Sphingomonas sp.]
MMAEDKAEREERLRLVRDVLDSQMVDRHDRQSGKVDGIVAELREDGRLVIVAVENGLPEAVRRVSPRVAGWIAALGRRWGVRKGEVYRIPFAKVRRAGITVCLDLDADETPLLAWEKWLREHVIRHIPGAKK